MLQGVGVGGTGWLPQVRSLSQQFRTLYFDNRGFGASQPIAEPITVELMAQDVLALLDAQGWDSAHVVGHSLGGLVALYVAHAALKRVRSLSLLCTFATGRIPTRLDPWLLGVGMRTRIGTRRMRRHAFLQMVLAPEQYAQANRDALAEEIAEVFGHDLADQPPVVMKQMGAMRRGDATSFLADLSAIPTLVVSATHDRIAPPYGGRALAEGIPGARYVEIPGSAHGVPITHAAEVNTLLLEHLTNAERHWLARRG